MISTLTALTPDSPSETVPEMVPPVELVEKFPGTVREGGVTSPPPPPGMISYEN